MQMRVTDYSTGEYEGTVIWEAVVPLDDAVGEYLDMQDEALWMGLK